MIDWRGVEARLVEAMRLWRRSPGSGFGPGRGSPFAADAPWHLMTRRARASAAQSNWEAWWVEMEAAAIEAARDKGVFAASDAELRGGLDRDEVARRDEASEWLALVAEADRALVVAVVAWRARRSDRLDWGRLLAPMGLSRGKDGLRMRYRRALERVAHKLGEAGRAAA